jgi:hypothetical protein
MIFSRLETKLLETALDSRYLRSTIRILFVTVRMELNIKTSSALSISVDPSKSYIDLYLCQQSRITISLKSPLLTH